MEAGLLPLISTLSSSWSCRPTRHQSRFLSKFRSVQFVSSLSPPPSPASSGAFKAPMPRRNPIPEWVSGNDAVARILPIFTGGTSLILVLLNRTFSGIAPVADASRAWESLSTATCCRSFVVVHGGNCLLQVGVAAKPSTENGGVSTIDVPRLTQGSLYRTVVESGKQSYLANLSLYPGRTELPFLPSNTQAVILQPLGDKGIMVIGGDTIRGFTNLDQAWVTSIAEKLDATLSKP